MVVEIEQKIAVFLNPLLQPDTLSLVKASEQVNPLLWSFAHGDILHA